MEPCSSASVIHHTTQKRAREERNWFWLVNCLAKSRWQNNAPFGVGGWKTLGTRLHGVNKLLRTVQTVPYPQCLWSSWHSVASWMPGIAQTVDIFSVLLYSASYPLRPHPSISIFRSQRKLKIIVKPVHLDSFEYKFRHKKKNERIQQVYTSNDRSAYCIIIMHGRSTIKEKTMTMTRFILRGLQGTVTKLGNLGLTSKITTGMPLLKRLRNYRTR